MSCVRARGAYVRSDLGENPVSASFPFPFSPWEVFPFPSALQGPIQLQLALSVGFGSCFGDLLFKGGSKTQHSVADVPQKEKNIVR